MSKADKNPLDLHVHNGHTPTMKFREWMSESTASPTDAAEAIGVSIRTIYRYLSEERIPDPKEMLLLHAFTEGQVTANDFYNIQ